MRRRTRRLYVAVISLVLAAGATLLVLRALQNSVTYFYSPSEIAAMPTKPGGQINAGGLVLEGSLKTLSNHGYEFAITDLNGTLTIFYDGLLPNLFREGQGVVVRGQLAKDGTMIATEVLAKHDENYMPPEVAKAIKQSGEWRNTTNDSLDESSKGSAP